MEIRRHMMVDCGLVSRLPVEWHSLFKQLGSSVERGNVWFTEETSSLYGSQPTWHKLFASMTKCDPTIEDDKLKFKPRFLLLPAILQENLLKFLLHQSFSIPDVYIKQFVLGVIGYMGIDTNIYQQITLLFRETKFSDEVLMNAIKKCPTELGDTLQESQLTPKEDTVLPGSQNSVIILSESGEEETQEPAYKRQKLEEDVHLSSEIKKKGAVAMETDEIENVQKENLDTNVEEDSCSLFAGAEGVICRIKEIWQNCISDSEIEGLSEVSKLSVKEIEVFCKMMDFDSMSDESIELVCKHLCQVSDSLSYSSAVCILTFVLGHRIVQLSQKASRKLSGAVTLVSQKFPKQTVDSILLPCMLQLDISAVQSELLCKIVKECLSTTTKGYFILKLMQNSFDLNENKIPILQAVIDSNCDMTQDVLSGFLHCLNEASHQFAKNLKFGKLLLALVNKHGKLFNSDLKNKFEIIVNKQSTFLKKTIQNALHKIKFV